MCVCCKYYSDLTLHTQVRSKGMVKVLQFKVTVWPKVASELTYDTQKFQDCLWGSIPQTPPSCFCIPYIPYCKWLKAGRGLGLRLLANVVCPHRGVRHGASRRTRFRNPLDFKWISDFRMDFGFQNGFLDFKVDFWISKWISGFQSGFLDFKVDFSRDFWVSSEFLDFKADFWISFEPLLIRYS